MKVKYLRETYSSLLSLNQRVVLKRESKPHQNSTSTPSEGMNRNWKLQKREVNPYGCRAPSLGWWVL